MIENVFVDAAAEADVSGIVDQVEFATIDPRGLASGGRLPQHGGPLTALNLIKLGRDGTRTLPHSLLQLNYLET